MIVPDSTPAGGMPAAYLELAAERVSFQHPRHRQPEDFGYDFRGWVSPFTKGAHALGGIAVVLQDWAGADALSGAVDPGIQRFGRIVDLHTNRRLEQLLSRVFGLTLEDVYATNIFPFIKSGGMSASIPKRDVVDAARRFTRRELEIVNPKIVLALGRMACDGLRGAGVPFFALPHPAARIGSIDAHEKRWQQGLSPQLP